MGKKALVATTLGYDHIVDGLFSVSFGTEDVCMAFFGLGLDFFTKVSSGIVIWPMIRGSEETTTGILIGLNRGLITRKAFSVLRAESIIKFLVDLYWGRKPESTYGGMSFLSSQSFPCACSIKQKRKSASG